MLDNLAILSNLVLRKHFWSSRPKVNDRRVYWSYFYSSNILSLSLFPPFKRIIFFKNTVYSDISLLRYIIFIAKLKNRDKRDIDMRFYLKFRVKLIGVAVQSQLYLLLILMTKVKPDWMNLFVILNAIKQNDASSTIHHCTYPVFYLSLVIF